MNSDIFYCTGFGFFDQPDICKNCIRNIPYGQEVPENVMWWTDVQYNPITGDCPLFVSKPEDNKSDDL